jgi:hypothetical protein
MLVDTKLSRRRQVDDIKQLPTRIEFPRNVDVEYSEIVLGVAGPLSSCKTSISCISVLRKITSSVLGAGSGLFPSLVAIRQGRAEYVAKHNPRNSGNIVIEIMSETTLLLR